MVVQAGKMPTHTRLVAVKWRGGRGTLWKLRCWHLAGQVCTCVHTKEDVNFTLRNCSMVLPSWGVRRTSCLEGDNRQGWEVLAETAHAWWAPQADNPSTQSWGALSFTSFPHTERALAHCPSTVSCFRPTPTESPETEGNPWLHSRNTLEDTLPVPLITPLMAFP